MNISRSNNDNDNNNSKTNNKNSTISNQITRNLKTATRFVLIMVIVLGIAYPLVLVLIGQVTIPFQSNGSIVDLGGQRIGSK